MVKAPLLNVMQILSRIARLVRALAFAYKERAELLKLIAALNTMVVAAKAETARALMQEIADSPTITAANAALAKAQEHRDAAVEAAAEAVQALEEVRGPAAVLQTLVGDDAVEDKRLDGILSKVELRIPEDFGFELPFLSNKVAKPVPVEEPKGLAPKPTKSAS